MRAPMNAPRREYTEATALQREILEFATRGSFSSLWNTQEASTAVQSKEFLGYALRVVRFPGERAIGEYMQLEFRRR